MWSGGHEYKNIKRLKVVYPECDDKHEYQEPTLCRARDMGKVIYGKWIIGGEQASGLTGEVFADDEEKFYTAYKLVGGAKILCNFGLDIDVPFIYNVDPTYTAIDEQREYLVSSLIANVKLECEPETDVMKSGIIYIKMPSSAGTKQTDNATEEKFADRPQILNGDIVRVAQYGVTRCFVVWDVDIDGVYVDSGARVFSPEQIISIYRLGERDFELIWMDEKYYRRIWGEMCATASKAAEKFTESMKSVVAALEKMNQYAKEAKDKASE